MEAERDHNQLEVRRLIAELDLQSSNYLAIEKEKKRLDTLIKNVNDQADEKLYNMHQSLEKLEQKLRDEGEKYEQEMAKLAREVSSSIFLFDKTNFSSKN